MSSILNSRPGYRTVGLGVTDLLTDLYNSVWAASITNTPAAGGSTVAAVGTITGSNAQNFDCTGGLTAIVYFSEDSGSTYRPIPVDIAEGATPSATTGAEVIASFNNNTMFTKHFVASVNSNAIRITSRGKSTRIKFYITGTCVSVLGFASDDTAGEANAGTGDAVSTVECIVKDCIGNPMPHQQVKVTLYNASTGSTKDSAAIIQAVAGDAPISGLYTNECVIESDENGVFSFDVASAAGATNTVYIGFDSPDGDYPLVTACNSTRTSLAIEA